MIPHGWLIVHDGRITAYGHGAPPPAAHLIDAEERTLLPGFIDVHVHGGAGS
ncbi:MAG: N-acetylglucosamine-6-phosphate deacetylase, partial [Anaerolinea sp.]|nr:N-acetylglucosamine-6-phosphate deacetylase [Anaerolinea sp.]